MQDSDVCWLMEHTVPLPGERGAALESWYNVLQALGWGREAIAVQIERTVDAWVGWEATPRFTDT